MFHFDMHGTQVGHFKTQSNFGATDFKPTFVLNFEIEVMKLN